MRILFDTNVILDVLLDREPFSSTAAKLFSKVETGEITGYVCATTITTLHYLASKVIGADSAIKEINKLMILLEVAPVNRAVLDAALTSGFKDFEDALQNFAAVKSDIIDLILTRNVKDYSLSNIGALSPDNYLKLISDR